MPVIVHSLSRLTLAAGTSLSLFGGSLPAQQAERYTLPGNEVAIYNLAGEVRLEQGGTSEVTVAITRGGAHAAKLKVATGKIEGHPSLRVMYPGERITYPRMTQGSSTQLRVKENGTFGHNHDDDDESEGRRVSIASGGEGLQAYADLRVTVPIGKEVALHLATGKVAVTNVSGKLEIETASAPVTTSNTRGELSIEVGSGPVQVSQARGQLSVETGSGSIDVTNVRGAEISVQTGTGAVTGSDLRSGRLSVETGSGDIQVTGLAAPEVNLQTGSGSVTADLRGDLWDVSVQTGSGDVTLRVPPTLDAEVDIETSSGEIETDFEVAVTRHARDHLTGRIGEGAGKIEIDTGSGGIRLVKGGG